MHTARHIYTACAAGTLPTHTDAIMEHLLVPLVVAVLLSLVQRS